MENVAFSVLPTANFYSNLGGAGSGFQINYMHGHTCVRSLKPNVRPHGHDNVSSTLLHTHSVRPQEPRHETINLPQDWEPAIFSPQIPGEAGFEIPGNV